MIGFLIMILGGYTSYRLWGDHRGLAIFSIIVTLYQMSSLAIISKENNTTQTILNLLATIFIIALCVCSFILN